MHFKESIILALDVIRNHKMRSFLTLLGIIIGVMSIIGMQSLIEGFQDSMKEEMEALGANVFQVQRYPNNFGGHDRDRMRNRKKITWLEADAIEKHCKTVSRVGPESWQWGVIAKYQDKKTSPSNHIAGGVPAFFPNNGYYIGDGRAISDVDVQQNRMVTVLGMDIVDALFPFEDPIGKFITADGHRYQVVGVLEEMGRAFGESKDNKIIIPLTTFQKYYGSERSLNITVQADTPELMDEAIEEVIGVLRAVRKVPPGEPNDFEIWTSESLLETFNNMTAKIRIGAIVIVSFSLLVAGIGIMNIMLVSIRERTREIGVRMAIGAKRRDISAQFLIEAIFLSIFGGFIGILAGVGIGQLVALLTPVPASIPVLWIIFGFVFCSIVGLIFGFYPAWRASKLDPIESLRFE